MNAPPNLASVTKRFLQLQPVNATSGGVYSFRGGLPLIKFDISSSDAPLLLDGSSIRLNGRFTARQVQGGPPNRLAAGGDLNFLDGFTGINQCIESITIYSKRLNSVLERINGYSRLIPSITSGTMGFKDCETIISNYAGQHNTTPLTRPALNCYNGFDANGAVTAANQRGQTFSTPIYAGMFQSGQDIDLSAQSVGGLVIEILLRADVGTIFGAQANTNSAYYEFDNLVLSCPVYENAQQSMAPGQISQYNFNTWSHMFQTINSSNSVVALTPGLSRVSSVLMNSTTSANMGDQRFNSSLLGEIGEIQRLRFSRNGAIFPLQYRLQTVSQQNNNVAKTNINNPQSYEVFSTNADIFRNYLEGLTTDRYNKCKGSNNKYSGWSGGSKYMHQNAGRDGITPQPCGGFAMLYDNYGSGTNFSQVVWSIELEASATSTLEIGNVNVANNLDGTAATAQALNIWYLNKNTLMFSGNGIDVVR